MANEPPVDILISYKSEERSVAARLAAVLAAQGWRVWWDYDIVAGDAYRKVIAQKLVSARCVIVLWSRLSVDSDFVLDEAGRAHRRGVLIPVRIEDVDIPLGFGQQDYTDLIDWDGDDAHPGFQELRRSIQGRLTGVATPQPLPLPRRRWIDVLRSRAATIGLALAIVALSGAMWWWPGRAPREPAPSAVQLALGSQVIAAGLVLPSGYIVTPCHVVAERDDEIIISGAGAWNGPATVRERHCEKDLALIESSHGLLMPNQTVVRFAGSLAAGEAIERYRGASDRTPGTVITPLESMAYPAANVPDMKLLVITNVSAGGDSGAPVLDGQGRMVGMLVAGDGATRSLAIPMETIRETFINTFAP